jgi:hypothetical protein
METYKAIIQRGTQVQLVLKVKTQDVKIVLNEDNPNNVKGAFNKLIKELKLGEFKFQLEDKSEDIYKHICVEYLKQLNAELATIYQELEDNGLTEEEDEEEEEEEE